MERFVIHRLAARLTRVALMLSDAEHDGMVHIRRERLPRLRALLDAWLTGAALPEFAWMTTQVDADSIVLRPARAQWQVRLSAAEARALLDWLAPYIEAEESAQREDAERAAAIAAAQTRPLAEALRRERGHWLAS